MATTNLPNSSATPRTPTEVTRWTGWIAFVHGREMKDR